MKFFKNVKSLAVVLIALALVCTAFVTTKAHADTTPIKATFTAGEYKFEIEDISKTKSVTPAVILAGLVKGEDALNAKGEYYISSIKISEEEVELNDKGAIVFPEDAAANLSYDVTTAKISFVYNPDTDEIDVTAANGVVIYIGTAKDATTQISKKATKDNLTVSGTSISISLSGAVKNKSVKIAEDKDAFLYIGTAEPTKDVPQDHNFAIKGTVIKKIDVAFNYAKAYEGNSSNEGIVTLKNVTDKDNAVDILNTTAVFMSTRTEGKDKKESDWATVDTITGESFYTFVKLNSDKDKAKYKLTFKVKGSATSAAEGYDAERGSKVKTVGVAKEAKAPKVKVDYAKGTIALKNGFDYVIAATGSAVVADAKTILPYNKSDSAAAVAIVDTTAFKPVAKFVDTEDVAKANYTKVKVKAFDLVNSAECKTVWAGGSVYISVRKSATAKKPASKFTTLDPIAAPATGPAVKIADGVLASAKVDGDKKVALTPTFNADCEYCIVKSTDLATLDLTTLKWKKLAKGKGKITSADKANYKVGDDKVEVNVTDNDVIVLVRTAGVKAKGTTPGTLPSDYIKTKVTSDGTNYVWSVVNP